jgi:hypothetical protein
MEKEILYEKNGTKIIKNDNGNYNLSFSIENKNMILAQILNFDLIKLIYDLNKDICEKINLEKCDENVAVITILLKNLFEDLGLPQKYSFLHITKNEIKDRIIFDLETISIKKPDWINNDVELANVKSIKINCGIISPHKTQINCSIDFDEDSESPAFVQKMTVMMVNKIINRLKQFIENVAI